MKRKVYLVLALVLIFALMAIPVSAAGPNLVVNGNFEAGNMGFYSDYDYQVSSLTAPFVYGVGVDPNDYHGSWVSFGDHTTGSGNMMIINASEDPDKVVWGQEVTLACDPIITSFTLYAGQAWAIGEVLVKNAEEGKICVKFVLTDEEAIAEGWLITEAHAAVAATVAEIPQKNGNPIPGKFPVNEILDPGVTETEWFCLDYEWAIDEDVIVAAHAKVELPELGHMETYNFSMTSGTGTFLADGSPADLSSINPWGNVDDTVNTLSCPETADWIWDAEVATGYYADNGGMVDFTQDFAIVGTPTSATLRIAADNSFAYSFNGGVEVSENLAADWRDYAVLGDFGYPYVVLDPSPTGWSQVYEYNVLGDMVSGSNVFDVTGVNADWNTTSWAVNPAAVIYKLCGTSEQYLIDREYDDESAWGGEGEFSGKNWAKYITYTPVECPTLYEFSFWAANSYPAAPAYLEIYINDICVGYADLSTIDPLTATWQEFTIEWDAGTATSASIVIKDSTAEYSGDDYCLDDITFGLQ